MALSRRVTSPGLESIENVLIGILLRNLTRVGGCESHETHNFQKMRRTVMSFRAEGINSWKYLAVKVAQIDEIALVAIRPDE
jgi:hypothetical protein